MHTQDSYGLPTAAEHLPSPYVNPRTHTLADSVEPGIEVVPASEADKQVVQPEKQIAFGNGGHENEEKEAVYTSHNKTEEDPYLYNQNGRPSKILGLRSGKFWALLITATIVIALAVGLGAGLTVGSGSDSDSKGGSDQNASETPATNGTSSSPSPSPSPSSDENNAMASVFRIGGDLDPTYYAQQGAWNGSGMSIANQRFAGDLQDAPTSTYSQVLYYQHHSGEIRWMRRTTKGTWVRGEPESEIVATNARNSTPIATIHYNIDGTSTWHVFYIDSDNNVRQRTGSSQASGANSWSDGSINDQNLKTYDGDLIGLHAVWAGWGGRDAIRLWYASNSTTYEEYLLRSAQDGQWVRQKSWPNYNAAAGVGCYSWSVGDLLYASFVNLENSTEFWYKNKTQESTGVDAPWLQTNLLLRNTYPASSIRLSNDICVIQIDDPPRLQVSQMNWSGIDTSATATEQLSLEGEHSVPGTHLWATTSSGGGNSSAGPIVQLLYQAYGNDIVEAERGLQDVGASWTKMNLDVPD